MTPLAIPGVVLIVAGLVMLVISAVGILRLPDFYTRTHAVAKSETLGLLLIFGGLLLLPGTGMGAASRLVLILVFSVIANPTAVHALARAARRSDVPVWHPEEPR